MKREMTCLKRTNGLFTIGKRLIERLEMTYLALVNDLLPPVNDLLPPVNDLLPPVNDLFSNPK